LNRGGCVARPPNTHTAAAAAAAHIAAALRWGGVGVSKWNVSVTDPTVRALRISQDHKQQETKLGNRQANLQCTHVLHYTTDGWMDGWMDGYQRRESKLLTKTIHHQQRSSALPTPERGAKEEEEEEEEERTATITSECHAILIIN
jgi:hypothetical protein